MAAPSDNLYVVGLPQGMDNASFQQIFAQYGNLVSCKVLPSKKEGQPGAGLVRMQTVEEAKWLVENLSGGIPQGMATPVEVRYAQQKSEQKGWSKGDSKGEGKGKSYEPYGKGDTWSWGKDSWGKSDNWGACGKGGKGKRSMESVFETLHAANSLPGGKGASAGAVCLYVWGIPVDTEEADLYKLFTPFGAVCSVKVMKDWDTGNCKGFGFVNYLNMEEAQVAISVLNSFQMPNGKTLNVSVKQEGKGGKGAKGDTAAPAWGGETAWAGAGTGW